MRVLSIDIGTKNLGWCVLDTSQSPPIVERAEVANIDGGTIRETIVNLIALFRPHLPTVDAVLVEQQPLRHVKMMSLMYALFAFVRGATDRPVHIVSPLLRVSYLELAKDVSYSKRKRASVDRVLALYGPSLLAGHGKKLDDLSDAIVQALAWTAVHSPAAPAASENCSRT